MFKRKNFKAKKKSDSEKKTNTAGRIPHQKVIVDEITFHSKTESDYYKKLKADKENGLIKDFEMQVKFLLQEKFIIVNGETILGSHSDFNKIIRKTKATTIRSINYIPDFVITYNDGSMRAKDTKGISTTDFEIKKKMFMYKYPHIPLDVIIYNKKTKEWEDYYEYQKNKKKKGKTKKEK